MVARLVVVLGVPILALVVAALARSTPPAHADAPLPAGLAAVALSPAEVPGFGLASNPKPVMLRNGVAHVSQDFRRGAGAADGRDPTTLYVSVGVWPDVAAARAGARAATQHQVQGGIIAGSFSGQSIGEASWVTNFRRKPPVGSASITALDGRCVARVQIMYTGSRDRKGENGRPYFAPVTGDDLKLAEILVRTALQRVAALGFTAKTRAVAGKR